MLEESMQEVGYAGPMVSAADGEILDGSARHETIKCACGCGKSLLRFHPKFGTDRRFIHGHNSINLRSESICEVCGRAIFEGRKWEPNEYGMKLVKTIS